MTDVFAFEQDRVFHPSRTAFAITPHDSNAISPVPKAIYVGGGGNITLRTTEASSDVVFANVPDGAIIPVRARFIRATGTTATNIVGLA
jgi:hypothetical protein